MRSRRGVSSASLKISNLNVHRAQQRLSQMRMEAWFKMIHETPPKKKTRSELTCRISRSRRSRPSDLNACSRTVLARKGTLRRARWRAFADSAPFREAQRATGGSSGIELL